MTETPPPAHNPYAANPNVAPAPANPSNGLGIAALIIGIIAAVGAFIPILNYVTGFIAFVGLVLGIVALFLKNKAKGVAIAGTIVSVVALILSIVLAMAYTAGFVAAVDNAVPKPGIVTDGSPTSPNSGGDTATDIGTRDNPAPIGTTITLISGGAEEYEVTLGTPVLDATSTVVAANMFNKAPEEGLQYALVPITVTYIGTETGTPMFDVQVEFVSSAGTTHRQSDAFVIEPDPSFGSINELYPDATATGNVVIAIPTADAAGGTWAVSSLFGDKFFFAAE